MKGIHYNKNMNLSFLNLSLRKIKTKMITKGLKIFNLKLTKNRFNKKNTEAIS